MPASLVARISTRYGLLLMLDRERDVISIERLSGSLWGDGIIALIEAAGGKSVVSFDQ